jgi:hypothetical protein
VWPRNVPPSTANRTKSAKSLRGVERDAGDTDTRSGHVDDDDDDTLPSAGPAISPVRPSSTVSGSFAGETPATASAPGGFDTPWASYSYVLLTLVLANSIAKFDPDTHPGRYPYGQGALRQPTVQTINPQAYSRNSSSGSSVVGYPLGPPEAGPEPLAPYFRGWNRFCWDVDSPPLPKPSPPSRQTTVMCDEMKPMCTMCMHREVQLQLPPSDIRPASPVALLSCSDLEAISRNSSPPNLLTRHPLNSPISPGLLLRVGKSENMVTNQPSASSILAGRQLNVPVPGKPQPSLYSPLLPSLAHAVTSLDDVTCNKEPLRGGIPNKASIEGDTRVSIPGIQLAGDSTTSFGDIDPASGGEPKAAAQELGTAIHALLAATQKLEAACHPPFEHFQREPPTTLNSQNGPYTEKETFSSGKKKTRRSRNKHHSLLCMGYGLLNLLNLLTAGMGIWLNQATLMMNYYLQFSRFIMCVSVISLWFRL